MTSYLNILSIMGEGRNVGKTLLACSIIAKFSRQYDIIGLKITDHKHRDTGKASVVFTNGESILMEETDPESTKDTGRMLAAGAVKSYLLQTTDTELKGALISFFSRVGKNALVVCESGKLGTHPQTGIKLFVRQLNCQVCDIEKKVPPYGIDRIITYTVNGFDFDLNAITVVKNSWKLKKD